ncbi:MAG: hypothetical protein HXX11_14165 [Desulfuromonadales bacterium]|nr:hypothetical protein [Desulfuromonadales bacterium]
MKTSACIVISTFLMSAAVPVFALDASEQARCNISAHTCFNVTENLQTRIAKLRAKITMGEGNYSAKEMKMLEQKLQAAMDQLDKVEGNK